MKRSTIVLTGVLLLAACTDRDVPTAVRTELRPVRDVATTVVGPAVQVAAGSSFACAIKTDATLSCWGNSTLAQTVPAGTFSQVSLSAGFGCAVRTDGTLACWGDNTNGQATPPSGTFTRVSTGAAHACAIRADGSLACWGDNFFDQLFAPISGSYVQIKASADRTCAIKADASLVCWGDLFAATPVVSASRIGGGTSAFCAINTSAAVKCWGTDALNQASPPTGTFTEIDGVGDYSCAIATAGSIACWGASDDGQTSPPNGTFTQLSTGSGFGCAVTTAGRIDCWGRNGSRQGEPPVDIAARVLTTTTLGSTPEPSATGETATFTATVAMTTFAQPVVSGSVSFIEGGTCAAPTTTLAANVAVGASGQASFSTTTLPAGAHTVTACYGGATIFQPSAANTDHDRVPAGPALQVSAGQASTCAIRSNRTLLCWGSGVPQPLPTGTFGRVSMGAGFGCAIHTDGSLACWGDNTNGKSTAPSGTFSKVSAGLGHACAIRTDGRLACWGDNFQDQSEGSLGSFLQVSAADTWSCGVRSDAMLVCWGTRPTGMPSSVSSVRKVSRGSTTVCVVLRSANADCWGSNVDGEASPPSGSYVDIDGAYGAYSCGVRTTGSAACWGAGFDGQTPKPPIASFVSVSTAATHACGLTNAAHVACWGDATTGATATPLEMATNVPTTTAFGVVPSGMTTFGQSVTFTATVTMTSGGSAVTAGTVAFVEGQTCDDAEERFAENVALDATGHASFTTTAIPVGSHDLRACYGGSATFGRSSGERSYLVNAVTTTTVLTAGPAQYSDGITLRATVSPTLVAGSALTGTVQFRINNSNVGAAVTLGAGGIATLANAPTAVGPGQHTAQAVFVSTNTNFAGSSTSGTLAVGAEDATVVYPDANPAAVQVTTAGGTLQAGGLSLSIGVKEKEPDAFTAPSTGAAGNIANAGLTVALAPVGPGSGYSLTCTPVGVTGSAYAATRNFTCTNASAVAVNVYEIQAAVTGNFYAGSYTDALVVYDPSLGFAGGGGTFLMNGDRVRFGINLKYKKNGADAKGSVIVVRQHANGTTSTLSSNALGGLALGDDPSVPMGWAAISGKANYISWSAASKAYVTAGGQTFTVYAEDRGNPGKDTDRIWVGGPGVFAMPGAVSSAQANATPLLVGNVVIPHRGP